VSVCHNLALLVSSTLSCGCPVSREARSLYIC
jgi:hypothetical protein